MPTTTYSQTLPTIARVGLPGLIDPLCPSRALQRSRALASPDLPDEILDKALQLEPSDQDSGSNRDRQARGQVQGGHLPAKHAEQQR
jgi:hypothetical protein